MILAKKNAFAGITHDFDNIYNNIIKNIYVKEVVRMKGFEPLRRETLDPKSSASANSATFATRMILTLNIEICQHNFY